MLFTTKTRGAPSPSRVPTHHKKIQMDHFTLFSLARSRNFKHRNHQPTRLVHAGRFEARLRQTFAFKADGFSLSASDPDRLSFRRQETEPSLRCTVRLFSIFAFFAVQNCGVSGYLRHLRDLWASCAGRPSRVLGAATVLSVFLGVSSQPSKSPAAVTMI